jgi:hypothetical protein
VLTPQALFQSSILANRIKVAIFILESKFIPVLTLSAYLHRYIEKERTEKERKFLKSLLQAGADPTYADSSNRSFLFKVRFAAIFP